MYKTKIKELREKCSAALAKCNEVKTQLPEKQAEFDGFYKEFSDAKIEWHNLSV